MEQRHIDLRHAVIRAFRELQHIAVLARLAAQPELAGRLEDVGACLREALTTHAYADPEVKYLLENFALESVDQTTEE